MSKRLQVLLDDAESREIQPAAKAHRITVAAWVRQVLRAARLREPQGDVVIFVDSNVPMHLVGASHPHKIDAQRLLERCVSACERLVTDAEVLQEILHRYAAISRRGAIQPCFDTLLGIVDDVLPITKSSAEAARTIILGNSSLSARDATHLAVMRQQGVRRIMSFDSGLDGIPGIDRLHA